MIIVDTSVWIDFFNNVENEKTKKTKKLLVSDDEVAICGLIYTEILQGIKSDKEFNATKEILDGFI